MARIFKEIMIEGKRAYILFDTGSIRSYVRREFLQKLDGKLFHLEWD